MTNPSPPVILGGVQLETFPTDVVLKDTIALVGTGANKVLLVNLIDPRNPLNAGAITNSIFGDRLAITKDGLLLGTSFNGNSGGIQVATLGAFGRLNVSGGGLLADINRNSSEDIVINYEIL